MYRILIPGKTFFFGEYAALIGGYAVLLTTRPGFELLIEKSTKLSENPFHPLSPAGKYFQKYKIFFSNWQLQFIDHYNGCGGFGASTAQFLGVVLFKHYMENGSDNNKISYKALWDDYCLLNTSETSHIEWNQSLWRLPSGYDLWAQALGSINSIKRNYTQSSDDAVEVKQKPFENFLKNNISFETKKYVWPFADLDFLLVPTGFKVATHEHLKNLSGSSFTRLVELSEKIWQLFEKTVPAEQFFSAMKEWNKELESLNLIHSNTVAMLKKLQSLPEIIFAKGCGALGADVIIMIFRLKDRERVKFSLKEIGFHEFYGQGDLWDQEIRVQVC